MKAGSLKLKSKTNQISKNTSDAQQIERVKLDLLSLVSHELRTPLTGVLNALRVLRDEDVSLPERQKFLDMACRNAERLNLALNQLLDLSKLVSGRLVCRFHEVSLKPLLAAQFEALTRDAELVGLKLSTTGVAKALAELPVILGDAPRLEQVVKSLLENAMKFSPSMATVSVRLKSSVAAASLPEGIRVDREGGTREYVLLEVMNSIKEGAKVNQKNLFKIFSQQEGVLIRTHEGVGGSLAIGAEVLRQHGGALHVQVEEGTFTIWMALPILKSEQALLKVLESRMYALRTELGAISLVLVEVSPKSLKPVLEALKAALFRASDTVYSLPDLNQIAVLMDDCKKADAPKIINRLLENVSVESGKFLKTARVGLSSFPEDATDPQKMLDHARGALVPASEI